MTSEPKRARKPSLGYVPSLVAGDDAEALRPREQANEVKVAVLKKMVARDEIEKNSVYWLGAVPNSANQSVLYSGQRLSNIPIEQLCGMLQIIEAGCNSGPFSGTKMTIGAAARYRAILQEMVTIVELSTVLRTIAQRYPTSDEVAQVAKADQDALKALDKQFLALNRLNSAML
jgi:hypothetical protein